MWLVAYSNSSYTPIMSITYHIKSYFYTTDSNSSVVSVKEGNVHYHQIYI